VPGRTFEVQIVNSKENHVQDYLAAAVDTAMHIHLQEPAGDVLIFLTGQAEIDKVGLVLVWSASCWYPMSAFSHQQSMKSAIIVKRACGCLSRYTC